MIESIKGAITAINPAAVTVETTGGVGYLLNITLPTFTKLEHAAETRLLVHESIRDDAWVLYGFIDEDERELFRALVGVSGVGAGSARLILSAIPAADLRGVIAGGDAKRLKSVKGIGAKTAERIIVDLKDKIKPTEDTLFIVQSEATAQSAAYDEALAALVALEFPRAAAQKALRNIFKADPAITVEGAIKKAFAMM